MKASYPLVAVFSARSTTCTVRARLLVSTAASIKKSPGAKLFGISARREIPPSSVVDQRREWYLRIELLVGNRLSLPYIRRGCGPHPFGWRTRACTCMALAASTYIHTIPYPYGETLSSALIAFTRFRIDQSGPRLDFWEREKKKEKNEQKKKKETLAR